MRRTLAVVLFCGSVLILCAGLGCPFDDDEGFYYSSANSGYIPAPFFGASAGNNNVVFAFPYDSNVSGSYLVPWSFDNWGIGFDD